MGLHLSTRLYCLVDFLLAYMSVHFVMSLYLYRCVAGVLLSLVSKAIPPPAEHLLFPLCKVRLRISWGWRHHHDYCIIVEYNYISFVSMEFVGVLGCALRVLATERRHVGMVYVLIIFWYVSFMSFPSVDCVWSYWLLRLQIDLD